MKNYMRSWIVYINEKDEFDAIELEGDNEKKIRERGLKIMGFPVYKRKSDAIDYIKEVMG
jgi:hypothetical protein